MLKGSFNLTKSFVRIISLQFKKKYDIENLYNVRIFLKLIFIDYRFTRQCEIYATQGSFYSPSEETKITEYTYIRLIFICT